MIIDGIKVKADFDISEEEAREYVERGHERYKGGLRGITVILDGDDVELYYDVIPFTRLRRVTGYLAATSRWNNAKIAELRDRRPHYGEYGDYD